MDIVRHEALLQRVEVQGLRPSSVAADDEKLRAARPRRCGDRVESSPDNAVTDWHCQTIRGRQARLEGVRKELVC